MNGINVFLGLALLLLITFVAAVNIKIHKDRRKSLQRRAKAYQYFQSQRANEQEPAPPSSIEFKVKGTYFRAPDEISAARFCSEGDTLILVPEPDNAVDHNAVKVYTITGYHIGYVEALHSQVISRNIDHVLDCIVTNTTEHEIPFISAVVRFTEETISQPDFIEEDFQCSPEQKMQRSTTKPFDSYKYRMVHILVEGLYELSRLTIAKARTARQGDPIILKKGICDEYYPYRIDVFLADGTFIGHANELYSGEVYALFDDIVRVCVYAPIGKDTADRLAVSVFFPDNLKCPAEYLSPPGISFSYSGPYPEVKSAQILRKTDPMAALDILLPIVKKEKNVTARIECIACYYQLKDWESRISIITDTIRHISELTIDDMPQSMLDEMHRYLPQLEKQLAFSEKRLESQYKKMKHSR